MTWLFIDTNVLLHFKRPEEVNWLRLANATAVTIVLAPVVIRELDKQKALNPQQKLRKRARDIINALYAKLNNGFTAEIRADVVMEFLGEEPDIDFQKHGLCRDVADDWLIATILAWRDRHPAASSILVTDDLGMTVKARTHGVQAIRPCSDDRISDELDAEQKKIQQLQEELSIAKLRVPDLQISFIGGLPVYHFPLSVRTVGDRITMAREMERIREKHPLLTTVTTLPMKTGSDRAIAKSFSKTIGDTPILWTPDVMSRYNASLEDYYRQYEEYLRSLLEYQRVEGLTLPLEFTLKNSGNCPADDVDIYLHFPDGLSLHHLNDLASATAPEPPEAPSISRAIFGKVAFEDPFKCISRLSEISVPRADPPTNVSSLSIKKTNSYEVRLHVGRAKHGHSYDFAKLAVVFESFEMASSFQIAYSLSAANLPESVNGSLAVVVEKPPD